MNFLWQLLLWLQLCCFDKVAIAAGSGDDPRRNLLICSCLTLQGIKKKGEKKPSNITQTYYTYTHTTHTYVNTQHVHTTHARNKHTHTHNEDHLSRLL